MYILLIKIVKYSEDVKINGFKKIIIDRIKGFLEPGNGLHYEEKNDDTVIVSNSDVNLLWEIATAISLEGEKFIKSEYIQGTRKGIIHGSIQIVKSVDSENGNVEMRDIMKPGLIPRALELVEGLGTYFEESLINPLIIVENRTSELCYQQLKLNIKNMEPLNIGSGKYMKYAKCFIFDLFDSGGKGPRQPLKSKKRISSDEESVQDPEKSEREGKGNGKKPTIFLSHSSKDKAFVRKLAKDLEKFGVKTWVDEAEIKIGESLTKKNR